MSALTSLLARDKIVPVRKIEEAVQRQVVFGGDIETALLELDAADENVLAAYRAALFGALPATREDVERATSSAIAAISPEFARAHSVVPLSLSGDGIVIASAVPIDPAILQRIAEGLHVTPQTRIVNEVRIADALRARYGISAAPRLARLAERLRTRGAGIVPFVSMQDAEDALAPFRSSTPRVSWSFEDDGADEDATENESERLPDTEAGAEGDPFQRTIFLQPATLSAVSRTKSSPPRAKNDDTESSPETSPREDLLIRCRHGLRAASDREAILGAFFDFAARRFDVAILLLAHEDVGEIRYVSGLPAVTSEALRGQEVSTSRGLFGDVRRTSEAKVGTLNETAEDRTFARSLGRSVQTPVIAIPVLVRDRVVAVLYGDLGGEAFTPTRAEDVIRLTKDVSDAFERLILAKKVTQALAARNRSSRPPPDPAYARSEHLSALGVRIAAPPPPARETSATYAPPTIPPAPIRDLGRATTARSTIPPPNRTRPDPRRDDEPPVPIVEVVRIRNPASVIPVPSEPDPMASFGARRSEAPVLEALVRALCASVPEDELALRAVVSAGEAIVPILAERFPGPLWFDRHQPHARPPRGRDVGPIPRALVALRGVSESYVPKLLASQDDDARYYAARLAADMPHEEFIPVLRERLFDVDPEIRAAALEALASLKRHPEYVAATASLRDVAGDPRYETGKRAAAISALGALRDPDAFAIWISVLAEDEPALRSAALEALRSVTRQTFGENPAEWASWLDDHGAAFSEEDPDRPSARTG